MKKLIYNENTHEINIIEQEKIVITKKLENNINLEKIETPPSLKKRIRSCLKRNEIFIEIFSEIFIGVVGVIISFVGLKIEKMVAEIDKKQLEINQGIVEINERQLEILENDREPVFSCAYEWDYIQYGNQKELIRKPAYKISNNGGIAFDWRVYPILKGIIMYGNKHVFLSYKEELAFKEFEKESDGKYSFDYDEGKSFFEKLKAELGIKFIQELKCVMIEYINYENEKKIYYYSIIGGELRWIDEKDAISLDGIYIESNSRFSINEIVNIIKEKLK